MYRPSKYFGDNFKFSLTTSTKKYGSVATLGTLGEEKFKLAQKTPLAKSVNFTPPILMLKYMYAKIEVDV